jgi:hypothetical protein
LSDIQTEHIPEQEANSTIQAIKELSRRECPREMNQKGEIDPEIQNAES